MTPKHFKEANRVIVLTFLPDIFAKTWVSWIQIKIWYTKIEYLLSLNSKVAPENRPFAVAKVSLCHQSNQAPCLKFKLEVHDPSVFRGFLQRARLYGGRGGPIARDLLTKCGSPTRGFSQAKTSFFVSFTLDYRCSNLSSWHTLLVVIQTAGLEDDEADIQTSTNYFTRQFYLKASLP